jgi:voltage-gated potassium channel
MVFVHQACTTIVLVTLTLVLQSAGMAALIEWAKAHLPRALHRIGPWRSGVLMVRLTTLIVCLHMLEILLWAWFYRLYCFSTWESAFYFSATSYSTVGYGDLVLPQAWQLVGPTESITGVLMCGLSVSFLFAVVHRLVERDEQVELIDEGSKG